MKFAFWINFVFAVLNGMAYLDAGYTFNLVVALINAFACVLLIVTEG